MKLRFSPCEDGFDLHFADRLVLAHRHDRPALTIARGNSSVAMQRGNFRIDDAPSAELSPQEWHKEGDTIVLLDRGEPAVRLELGESALTTVCLRGGYDRIWLRWHAAPGETVWGGGEQLSYLALNGRAFPMWTS